MFRAFATCLRTAYSEVETDGRGRATMILPGETEAGSAGTQPCRGIAWWSYRCLENPRPKGGILTNGERPLSRVEPTHRLPSLGFLPSTRRSRSALPYLRDLAAAGPGFERDVKTYGK
jgi:hypothetical protein